MGTAQPEGMVIDLSVIIVNWKSKDYLRKCIALVRDSIGSIAYEIMVIDNASFDGSGEMLRECYPEVVFIQSEKNVGFALANNWLSRLARGEFLLFLNPDTEVVGTALGALYKKCKQLPNAGIVGPTLLNSDESVQTSCIRAFPTVLNQIIDSDLLRSLFPKASLWGMKPIFDKTEAAVQVDAVSGACLMIRRDVFQSVGMFCSDYFMYSEDIDLCFRVHKLGWKTFYVREAVVIHHGGGSSSLTAQNAFSSIMMLESRWRFFRKTRSLWYCLTYRVLMFLASIVRIASAWSAWPIYALMGRTASLRAINKKWAARLRWTVGIEKWVSDY